MPFLTAHLVPPPSTCLTSSPSAELERYALLRRGDLSVTEVCFVVGCSSLGTFSTRFTELVGMPPSIYRRREARATAGMPACVAKQVTKPIRNREAPVTEPHLA
ncbi:MAG TPA: helix-turn-helix domain-containing protein [Solirubrobacteraceae bacterium]|nr:helix-turn-helix domain-containing protein [Solirubrobacteraceae bacterium]